MGFHTFNVKDDVLYFTKAYWENKERKYYIADEKSHKAIYKTGVFDDEYTKIVYGI